MWKGAPPINPSPEDEEEKSEEISPHPALCIKSHLADSGRKIFINLLSHDRIELPTQMDKDAPLPESMDPEEVVPMRFPLSMNPPVECKDTKGDTALAFDVVLNPNVIKEASEEPDLLQFIAGVILNQLEERYQTKTTGKFKLLKKVTYKGSLPPPSHYIRCVRGPLVTEMAAVEQDVDPISHQWLARSNENKLLPITDVEEHNRREIVLQMRIPSIDSTAGLELDITESIVSLNGVGANDIRIPVPETEFLSSTLVCDEAKATFDMPSRTLQVSIAVRNDTISEPKQPETMDDTTGILKFYKNSLIYQLH